MQKSIDQRPTRVARSWVDHQSGRFVQNKDIGILVKDSQIERFGNKVCLFDCRQFDVNLLTGSHFENLTPGDPVDTHESFADDPLQHRAGNIRELARQVSIEAQTRIRALGPENVQGGFFPEGFLVGQQVVSHRRNCNARHWSLTRPQPFVSH